MDVAIRPVKASDAADIAGIYNTYVRDTCITFETEPVPTAQMVQRIVDVAASCLPWLVAQVPGRVVGYAYASQWKSRWAYRYSVESTVYLDPTWTAQGIGLRLYTALIDALRTGSAHAVIGGIALPNAPTIRLHERLGFNKVAHFEQVGYKRHRWVDVGYWQLLLDAETAPGDHPAS